MDFDVARHIGAIGREVRASERDGKEMRTVAVSRTYSTTVEDLWDAITNPVRLPRWFAPVTGDLRLGGQYQIEGNAGGEVTRCEPPSHLSLTWVFEENVSWVDVSLRSDDGGARLTIEHTAPPDDYWKKFGPGAAGVGWDMGFRSLARYVEADAPAIPDEATEWMASEAGRAFMRQSSEGWYVADKAAGTEEVAARSAAARTYAFYAGEEHPDAPESPGGD